MTPADQPTRGSGVRTCQACGLRMGSEADLQAFEIPLPASVSAALGLAPAPVALLRVICSACLDKGLASHPVTLAELVDLAPPAVKQAIHESLIHEFEI